MSARHISIREFDKLHIGEFSDLKPSVSIAQATKLSQLKATYGFEAFKWANQHCLVAQQYVGSIQIDNLTIEILPKIESPGGEVDSKMVRHNLVAMLLVSLDLDISEGEVARVGIQTSGILEILIRLFCDKLFLQLRRGLVRRYEQKAENLRVLRGKLSIGDQLRLNLANPERLFCKFDEFEEDNALNRVLKAAVRHLFKVSKDLKNQRQLAELALIFDGTSDIPVSRLPWIEVSFDRISERYRPVFKLAELFLKQTPPDITGNNSNSFSLLFDMNALFEEYIGRVTRQVCHPSGVHVQLQGPQRYIAFDEFKRINAFKMKPDIVGLRNNETIWIIDTKWKRLNAEDIKEGASQADLYQMYAYANNYACSDVVLLYPHYSALGDTPGLRGCYLMNVWLGSISGLGPGRIKIATVDLSKLKTVPAQMYDVIGKSGQP